MQEAIDTYVRIQADPLVGPDGGPIRTSNPQGPGSSGTSRSSSGVGGIDPVGLGGALKAGAANIPSGGAASGPTGAGNGGSGSPVLSGGAGSGIGAGNGGAAAGSFAAGGGGASFADAACYMIGNLCRYISRCVASGKVEGVCQVPSTCPALVAAALAKGNTTIPPQAAVTVRCFGDALGSASCVRDDFAEGLKSSFQRCGLSLSKDN
jgi:hypothetical protein